MYTPLFPYFGGKSKIAKQIWQSLGDCPNYIEPFFGSGATLFLRPEKHKRGVETVNDKDCLLANVWRAIKHDPDKVAYYAENPINHADLQARHYWLCNSPESVSIAKQIIVDPDFYNARAAGFWIWGMSCWIGSGWCKNYNSSEEKSPSKQIPALAGERGVICSSRDVKLQVQRVSERLKNVRVVCGDWKQVLTPCIAHDLKSPVGIFLDPPYTAQANRAKSLYREESDSIGHDVYDYAIANGDDPKYRIVLAGYEGEYQIPSNWHTIQWGAGHSFNGKGGIKENTNRRRERLYLSPHCQLVTTQLSLFK